MSVKVCDLYTVLGENVGENVWQEYPRPQMKRDSFLCLNGKWDFAAKKGKSFPREYSESILVPFCPESLLSGIHAHLFILPKKDCSAGRLFAGSAAFALRRC